MNEIKNKFMKLTNELRIVANTKGTKKVIFTCSYASIKIKTPGVYPGSTVKALSKKILPLLAVTGSFKRTDAYS